MKLIIIILMALGMLPVLSNKQAPPGFAQSAFPAHADTAYLPGEPISLPDSCNWPATATPTKRRIQNKKGLIYSRFGATIINIPGKAYAPCNLPPGLEQKWVLVSGIIYRMRGSDGIPLKLSSLQVMPN